MNRIKNLFYIAAIALVMPFSACEDPDLIPILEPETAVHGLAALASSSAKSFKVGDMTTPVSYNLQWVSIDSKNTVSKIEVFINYSEKYIDLEKNPRTANHGTKTIVVVEGGAVPANRTPVNFQITPQRVYDLFKDAQFDYGKGKVAVFSNPDKADRSATGRFITDDLFKITWAFTTADGRYFDSWSDSVCLEFPGANCNQSWTVTK